tara:strand:- start:291 stop:473 length:183 start_codon:yes stop_codon:yes gene_type:complete
MDNELLIALLVFWLSTTGALMIFLPMWFFNSGEAVRTCIGLTELCHGKLSISRVVHWSPY